MIFYFFRKAIQLNPDVAGYWLGLAHAEAQVGNMVSAMEAYEHAANLDSASPEVWVEWSLLHYEQGDYEKAVDLINEGIDELPEEAELYYYATAYLINAGKYKEAFQYLENALLLGYDQHPMLFEFFPELETQKALYKIIDQHRR